MTNVLHPDIAETFRLQRAAFLREGEPPAAIRIDRIERMIAILEKNEQRIVAALDADFRGRSAMITRWGDIGSPLNGLRHALDSIHTWMQPEERPVDNTMGAGRGYIYYQPLGVIGVVSTWNVPLGVGFAGFGNIFAAGNRVMIKMSEHAPASAELAQSMLAEAFDRTEAAAVVGDADRAAVFVAQPFDHILFTGSTALGRVVMRAAAENLTPVTLELGGKCPVIIGASADLHTAVPKILAAKIANSGQVCIAPDYVLLPDAMIDLFIDLARAYVVESYASFVDNPEYTSMISTRHRDRVRGYITEARSNGTRIEVLGSASAVAAVEDSQKMAPVVLVNPALDLAVSQEEIFGPVLPLHGYSEFAFAVDFVNERDRPLCVYYVGTDQTEKEVILHGTWSGGLTLNGIARNVGHPHLPFGGVGASGMGRYQAYEGFKTFSNARVVFEAQ